MERIINTVADSIEREVIDFCERHRGLAKEVAVGKPSGSGWTFKEIIGHLIDSASNNHQRITRLQLAPELQFPGYENEKWLATEKWNLLGWEEILDLFRAYNIFLAHVIRNVDPECLNNRWFGRDRFGERVYSLEEMIVDYRKHLREHLDQFEVQLKEIQEY
jgi:hypothetical protein